MKKLILLLCLICGSVQAADRITASITVTNAPTTNGMNLVVNSSTRTWTNLVASASTQILTNSSIGGITTNLWNHVTSYGFSLIIPQWVATNQLNLIGGVGQAMTVTVGGTWAAVTYSTQTVAVVDTVRIPMSALPNAIRTNDATRLIAGLNQYAQNGFTNMYSETERLLNPTLTNGINYGNAFSSPGTNSFSEQFGATASAKGNTSLAVGYGSSVGSIAKSGVAIGAGASATGTNATALGKSAQAAAGNAMALGAVASATSDSSIAIGVNALAQHINSVAIGVSTATSRTNQVKLGDSSYEVNVPGYITAGAISNTVYSGTIAGLTNGYINGTVVTNATYYGTLGSVSGGTITGTVLTNTIATNISINGLLRFKRSDITTLANGNNPDIVLTNVFNVVRSGPTAAFAILGIVGGQDGEYKVIWNDVAQNMTIAVEGGATGNDGVTTNRIISATGADVATTGVGSATLVYDTGHAGGARWILLSLTP